MKVWFPFMQLWFNEELLQKTNTGNALLFWYWLAKIRLDRTTTEKTSSCSICSLPFTLFPLPFFQLLQFSEPLMLTALGFHLKCQLLLNTWWPLSLWVPCIDTNCSHKCLLAHWADKWTLFWQIVSTLITSETGLVRQHLKSR